MNKTFLTSSPQKSLALFAILSILSMLEGCGRSFSQKQDNEVGYIPPVWREAKDTPSQRYTLANPSCQSSGAGSYLILESSRIHKTGIDTSGQNFTAKLDVTFVPNQVTGTPLVNSPMVEEITVGDRYERICSENPDEQNNDCGEGGWSLPWHQIKKGTPLKICDPNGRYERYSYESIAATLIYFLEEASRNIRLVYDGNIPKLKLELMPQYVSLYRNKKGTSEEPAYNAYHFMHNLAYFPSANKIAVLPEPADLDDHFSQKGHLWESPFSINHELGHHIEQQLLSSSFSFSLQAGQNPLPPFAPFSAFRKPPAAGAPSQSLSSSFLAGTTSSQIIHSAISEGFSDLISFYSIGEDQKAVTTLTGIGENRNPVDPYFYQGSNKALKKFDAKMLRLLDSDDAGSSPATMTYQLGSILAHTLDQSFRLFTEDGLLPYLKPDFKFNRPTLTRLKLTISWMELVLKSDLWNSDDSSYATYLQIPAVALEQIALNTIDFNSMSQTQTSKVKTSLCNLVLQKMPSLVPPFYQADRQSCEN
jgi:hypothetical protein